MDNNTMIVLVVLILAVAVIGAIVVMNARKTKHLKTHFGPEYERAIEERGDRKKAEAELHAREKRIAKFDLHPLRPEDRTRFTTAWTQIQSEFVDSPAAAVSHADELLDDAMRTRGYPVSDFDQRAADLSVEHPVVVQNYRAAHDIALKHRRGDAGTEDLRQAMIHYRALFEELVNAGAAPPPQPSRETARATAH
jgi:hypothetical protein